MKTRGDLEQRIAALEHALDQLLASHQDFIECAEKNLGRPSIDWAKTIHLDAAKTRNAQ